jgi:hypothetical protein
VELGGHFSRHRNAVLADVLVPVLAAPSCWVPSLPPIDARRAHLVERMRLNIASIFTMKSAAVWQYCRLADLMRNG